MSEPTRTLVVWCCDWPLVAGGVSLDQPAVVVHANRVVATSPAARAEGVVEGLRRREAQGRCPDLVVLAEDLARDARRFEPVVAAVEELCPRVEITRPGECALATRGPARYFGGDEGLARRTTAAVREVLGDAAHSSFSRSGHGGPAYGLCQVGVADTPFAARLAARGRTVGSSVPGGYATAESWAGVVPPGETAAFLAPFPVRVLERPELTGVMVRLGIRTLGELAELPRADLVGRFGAEGAVAHRLASGLDGHPPHARRPPPDLAVTAELDPPAERVDQAAFVGRALASDLHERLHRRGLACQRVAVEVESEHGERCERLWRDEGTLTPAAVADRVRWQLDGWLNGGTAHRPTAGITRIALVPDEVLPARGRQLGFWGGETAAAERAARSLARVAGLLGPEAVRVPEARGGRSPHEQVVLVPADAVDLTEPRQLSLAGHDDRSPAPWPGALPAPTPTTVEPEPRPVEVVDEGGRPIGVSGRGLVDAAPARVSMEGERWVDVEGWAGPWPLDERWWDSEGHRRRARFQVVTADGAALLLAVESGRWWLEAVYD